VDKYANNGLGGDPPANPPPPPPAKPTVGPPGAPVRVTASAGNATARVSWGPAAPNGAAIVKYVVEGDGTAHEVGANQRTLVVGPLTNGRAYTFTVYAVNAKGAGPKRAANPVVPTADVPDPPVSVTAKANPDGTVTVSWPPANGQGHQVPAYQLTPVSAGGAEQPLTATGPSLTVPAGTLAYGTQYAFTVIAVNDKGAGSKPSPVSNTVVPYTVPGAPKNVQAATVDAKGTIQVSWQPADDNGRPITRYVVTANGTSQDVTGTSVTLGGLADGVSVTATVKAVNAAGSGPGVSRTARTIAPPTVTLTGNPGPQYQQITVSFTVNGNGGATTCTLTLAGGGPSPIGCTGTTLTGLGPDTTYSYTVTVTNKAGSASAGGSQRTPVLNGKVICPNNVNGYCNSGIWAYRQPTQSGTPVNPPLPVGRTFSAKCQITGGMVDTNKWTGRQPSPVWIGFDDGGRAYFPWAWTTLDAGNNLGNLPPCH
jgi:Fibronectin type III domain